MENIVLGLYAFSLLALIGFIRGATRKAIDESRVVREVTDQRTHIVIAHIHGWDILEANPLHGWTIIDTSHDD